MFKKKDKANVELDRYELGLIIKSLMELRNNLIKDNQDYEFLDELILKLTNKLEKVN